MSSRLFSQRFIAFVDILGFSEIVRRMSLDVDLFWLIRDVLKQLDEKSRDVQDYRCKKRNAKKTDRAGGKVSTARSSDLQMTAFSDCYVLSDVSTPWRVLAAVQSFASHLLAEGILTRGGIVQGDAYHHDRVLFGPGVIDAYNLESDVAKYPRMIVEERVRRAVWDYHKGKWQGRLLKRDADGCWFVNLLVPSLSSWALIANGKTNEVRETYLTDLRRRLEALWDEAKGDPGHMSKVWWLLDKFNDEAVKGGVDPVKRAHDS
jgi:hypothetical protein